MIWKFIPCLLALLSVSCGDAAKKSGAATYSNPVIAAEAPDPSVIRAEDGSYYLYATGHGYSIFRSEDLVAWERVGTAFDEQTWPAAIRNERRGDLWAPEIRRIADRYVLFYTLWFGDVKYSVIGYAAADRPEGPFTDRGVLVDSQQIGVEQSIDPYYYEENGESYLFWGSFRNLYVMELDVTGDACIVPRPETKRLFAGTAFEGTNICKHDGWYYFFASTGDFAGGTESTYRTVAARSRNLLGPCTDKQGRSILDNGCELVLQRNDAFAGPGHNAGLLEDAEGRTWMFYHAYDVTRPELGRLGLLDEVRWDDEGWPYIENGSPSSKAAAPVVEQ